MASLRIKSLASSYRDYIFDFVVFPLIDALDTLQSHGHLPVAPMHMAIQKVIGKMVGLTGYSHGDVLSEYAPNY
jgi:hypothetical protein